jgi:hypothetical protein
MTSGQLRIVPSADLGELGDREGQAILLDWKWYDSAPGLLLWLALAMAIIVPKYNRDVRILLIAIPLLVMNLVYAAFKGMTHVPSSSEWQCDAIFRSLAVGITILWLLAPRLARSSGLARWLLSLGILAGVAVLGVLSTGSRASAETTLLFLFPSLAGAALSIAVAAAGRLCRRRYSPVRLMLWLGLFLLAGSIAAMSAFFTIGMTIASAGYVSLWSMLPQVLAVSLILGSGLYALVLPFMILGFVHPFFRDRLCAYLGLRIANTPGAPA